MSKPIMAKATAVWLVDNTTISFKQIADFVGMHELEVQGIADGDVATGEKGFDPIANSPLTQAEVQSSCCWRGKAPRPPLHTVVQATGPAKRDPLAGEISPRTGR